MVFREVAAASLKSACNLCLVTSWARSIALHYIWHTIVVPSVNTTKFLRLADLVAYKSTLGFDKLQSHIRALRAPDTFDAHGAGLDSRETTVEGYPPYYIFDQCINAMDVLTTFGHHDMLNRIFFPDSNMRRLCHPGKGLRLTILRAVGATKHHFISAGIMAVTNPNRPRTFLTHLQITDAYDYLDVAAARQAWPSLQYLALPGSHIDNALEWDDFSPTPSQCLGLKQVVFFYNNRTDAIKSSAFAPLRREYPFMYLAWGNYEPSEEVLAELDAHHADPAETPVVDMWTAHAEHGEPSIWDVAEEHTLEWEREVAFDRA